jgi:hypothetical protein
MHLLHDVIASPVPEQFGNTEPGFAPGLHWWFLVQGHLHPEEHLLASAKRRCRHVSLGQSSFFDYSLVD